MVRAKRFPYVRRYSRDNLMNLPDDTLLLLFQYLSAEDLCRIRRVCRRFNSLIENSSYVWLHTSFASIWPSPLSCRVFKRASKCGNLEAIIKMGISYLYNEGVTIHSSKKISPQLNEKNGIKAAGYFCQAEKATSQTVAFIWSFIRPPWASGAMCCKRHVFNSLVKFCSESEENAVSSIYFSLGKVLSLQQDTDGEQDCKMRARFWLEKAAEQGCSLAKFELWKQNVSSTNDPAVKLQHLRELRECAISNKEAALELVMNYVSGNIGNLSSEMAAEAVRQFLANSLVYRRRGIFQVQTDLNRTMRYILVDWLVEVSSMKHFSSHVLHAAVWYIDQFLFQRKTNRSELQLLGIGCMLIASRFYGEDIVTIRESSWLTDNTYPYEQVVRMIGEIMSCLRGETQVLTVPNYIKLFCELLKTERKVENFALYIADMSLLREHCARYTCAVVALSCILLGQLILYPDSTWCSSLEDFVPFDKHVVLSCMNFLFEKCVVEDCLVDKQNAKLKAVKERYNSSQFSEVSTLPIPTKEKMRDMMQYFSRNDETVGSADETGLNTTFCSIASSGYEGDDEDIEDIDDDEMMWYEDECEEQTGTNGASRDTPVDQNEMEMMNIDQIERTTPSFLSPSWLLSVINESVSSNTRSRSLGSHEPKREVTRVQYHSVGSSVPLTNANSRRPLREMSNRHQNNTSSVVETHKLQSRFRPIPTNFQESMENVDMENVDT